MHLLGGTSAFLINSAYSSTTAKVRRRASGWNSPVASTPWPSRTISVRRSRSRQTAAPARSAISSLIEFVPQSIAATVSRDLLQARPGPKRAESPDGLIPERVHSRAGGQRVRDEGMQALHPIRHPSRTDAGDLGPGSSRRRSAR